MKLHISESVARKLWTGNLPIKLEQKVYSLFSDFIDQGIKAHGSKPHYLLRTFDPNEPETIIELTFKRMDNGQYHISAVELRDYVDGEDHDTDLMAGYHHEDKLWGSMLRAERVFGHPEDFVANVLRRFNDYAKTGLPYGKFVNGEKYDNVMKDIYEGRLDNADTHA